MVGSLRIFSAQIPSADSALKITLSYIEGNTEQSQRERERESLSSFEKNTE